MALAGELVSLVVSLAQEIGIVAGVGALTITLVGHLLSLHARVSETVYGYVRAARHIRALALMAIIISGGAAILIHFQTQTPQVLVAPAFLFKWLLIALLTAFYFVELKVAGLWRDAVEGFEGANWYALFIVHTMAPVVGWGVLLSVYFGWLATFAALWAAFVWLMRRQSTLPPKPAAPAPSPAPAPTPPPAPPTPQPAAPLPPKPAPTPVAPPTPAPAAKKPVEIHPNHSMLPMIAELDLPAPQSGAPAPKAVPAPAPAPKPQTPVQLVPESSARAVQMPNLDQADLPALQVMPRRPEDIEHSRRGPVVKMSDE